MHHLASFAVLGLCSLAVSKPGQDAWQDDIPQAARAERTDRQRDPLPAGALARLGTTRFRHSNYIHALAYSHDGKLLASSATDALRVWDATTGKEQFFARPPGEKWQFFSALAFAPDGAMLAAVSWGGNIDLFEVKTGRIVRSWRAHSDAAWRVIFSADGKSLATTGRDGVVRIWDAQTGQERLTFGKPATMAGTDCAWSADGKTIVSVGQHKPEILIWDATTGKGRNLLATLMAWMTCLRKSCARRPTKQPWRFSTSCASASRKALSAPHAPARWNAANVSCDGDVSSTEKTTRSKRPDHAWPRRWPMNAAATRAGSLRKTPQPQAPRTSCLYP